MQLIARHEIADYARWRSAFEAESEALGAAGLSVLQIWREEGASAVLVLYQVSDRARAKSALDTLDALLSDRAGITGSTYHFVRTA